MKTQLYAQFTKSFIKGAVIEASLQHNLDDFSIGSLFGPSGCGKTTILRCLAGLERPEKGVIRFGNQTWFDSEKNTFAPPQKRKIGFLFQDYALFPHLTVSKNIAYGLQGLSKIEKQRRVAEMLDFMDLSDHQNHYPSQISGGQQQRVALARVMVLRPQLLLLDEPLSALDVPTRERIRPELLRFLTEFGTPTIMVSHDRSEVLALADYMTVMEKGLVLQSGPTQDIFHRPLSLSVARIVGVDTVEKGKIIKIEDGLATVEVGSNHLLALAPGETPGLTPEKDVFVCIRAEDVILQTSNGQASSARNHVRGKVKSTEQMGPLIRVAIDCGFNLVALVTKPSKEELKLEPGREVFALLKAPSIHLLPFKT